MNEHRQKLLDFIDASPTPFHAVERASEILKDSGFTALNEGENWELQSGCGYYLTRNGSSLIAFRLPEDQPDSFCIIGAHSDSPNLRLKPRPLYGREGYLQCGVEIYGGVLLNSWLDRDLSLAGRVFYRQGEAIFQRLVDFGRPLFRIPQLAIHLDQDIKEGLRLNEQTHLPPLLGLDDEPASENRDSWWHSRLLRLLTDELGLQGEEPLSFDLQLYPCEKGAIGGMSGEFIFAPRLDNLAMCRAALTALVESSTHDNQVNMIVLFDNEEVGSESAQGALSTFLPHTLERIFLGCDCSRGEYLAALSSSFFISADMAHAVHPNYADRHDEHHRPRINGGPVIKFQSNRRYATDDESAALFENICRQSGIPVQKFVNRSDLRCGSTIGPLTAAGLGIRTVDVGSAMLSMHSIREMAGGEDPELMARALTGFLSHARVILDRA